MPSAMGLDSIGQGSSIPEDPAIGPPPTGVDSKVWFSAEWEAGSWDPSHPRLMLGMWSVESPRIWVFVAELYGMNLRLEPP